MTPGFLSSTPRSAQFGSVSSRALLDAVASEEFVLERIVGQFARQGPGQSNRGCALRLSCTVLRAIPNTTAISRELIPLPASRSICRNCLMVSLLFAGIKISPFIAGHLTPKLLT